MILDQRYPVKESRGDGAKDLILDLFFLLRFLKVVLSNDIYRVSKVLTSARLNHVHSQNSLLSFSIRLNSNPSPRYSFFDGSAFTFIFILFNLIRLSGRQRHPGLTRCPIPQLSISPHVHLQYYHP